MIGIRDTFTLALTKLRTRKIRLAITVVISGVLFGALTAGSLTSYGVFKSVDDFTKEGFGSRYVTQASTQGETFYNNKDITAQAMVLFNEQVARKKAEAKKLGIEYDPASDIKPIVEMDTPGGKQVFLAPEHLLAKQATQEYIVQHPLVGEADFQAAAKEYDAKAFYRNKWASIQNGNQVQILKDGKESFQDDLLSNKGNYDPNGLDSFTSQWGAMSDDLLKTFISPGESLATGADGSIPIVVPYSAAQKFLKLKELPGSATAEERLERLKYTRTNLKNTTYEACYRNQTSGSLIENAKMAQREIAANKNKKEYKKPSLQYGFPTEPCGTVPIIRDVRTADEKKLAAKQLQFAEMFGQPKPAQAKLKFRVVGMSPDVNLSNFSRIDQIFSSIVQSSLGSGWFMPDSQLRSNPIVAELFPDSLMGQPPTYYAEFSTGAQVQKFIDERSCFDYDFAKCREDGRPFSIGPYGSNSIAVASLKAKANKFLNVAGIGVIILAAVIMMGTVGRMIADSRRETAVFRAIGAKRRDISAIYILYTILLSLLIAAFALVTGFLIASYLNDRFSAQLTAQALVAYNAQDMSRVFTTFGVNALDIMRIIGCVILAGLISAIIPLMRNIRRSPIRDMRDEN